jgi:hypothetical protein
MKYVACVSVEQYNKSRRRKKITFLVFLGVTFIMLCASLGLWFSWKSTQKDCYDSCMTYGLPQFISGIITATIGTFCLFTTLIIGLCLRFQRHWVESVIYKQVITSNVYRLPIHSSLDWNLWYHSLFRTLVKTGRICLSYSFIFRQSIVISFRYFEISISTVKTFCVIFSRSEC